MSCSPFELKDYFFGELSPEHRSAVEQHAAACTPCRAELSALTVTRSALLSVPDEEPPRRIAFVSDKVFEPAWWQRIWSSAPQLGFLSASVLALAILAHAFVARPQASMPVATVDSAVRAELAKQFDGAVQQALAASEERQTSRLLELLEARVDGTERRLQSDLKEILTYQQKTNAVKRHNAYFEEFR